MPKRFLRFKETYPALGKAYEEMSDAVAGAGPLDDRTRALVKLGIAIGARMEGAVHSHVRKAREAGCSKEEIQHAVLQATTTIGFPNMMAAYSWAETELEKDGDR